MFRQPLYPPYRQIARNPNEQPLLDPHDALPRTLHWADRDPYMSSLSQRHSLAAVYDLAAPRHVDASYRRHDDTMSTSSVLHPAEYLIGADVIRDYGVRRLGERGEDPSEVGDGPMVRRPNATFW